MVYVAGTTGMDRETGTFPEGATTQTRLALDHVEAALDEAGAELADVLRVTVYIADRADLMPVCEVIGEAFAEIRPANTTVIATLALPEMKVEIEVTARIGSAGVGRPSIGAYPDYLTSGSLTGVPRGCRGVSGSERNRFPPRHGRRRPTIHAFLSFRPARKTRGWSAFADHDGRAGRMRARRDGATGAVVDPRHANRPLSSNRDKPPSIRRFAPTQG